MERAKMSYVSNLSEDKMSDLTFYRESDRERERITDLMDLIPEKAEAALDIGARDGFIALKLIDYYKSVTALDLVKPNINHSAIQCVQGDVSNIEFADNSFDMVMCAEVLEHLPPSILEKACAELVRVSKRHVIIGVPYNQDIRVARTTCYTCGTKNPPWGHINRFDEKRLKSLFQGMSAKKISYIGKTKEKTNILSAFLMDIAGNPYGTYIQEETCIHCNNKLVPPPERSFMQKVCTKLGFILKDAQSLFVKSQPNWIHILFEKT
jgi:ubiquinone/menaquinone biosynthesis C-methylase UbiE